MKKTLVVNFYGGPGTGKSTTCAKTFASLKEAGVNCEMALEYAKDKVWEGSLSVFDNQIYIFAKQHHRIFRLLGKVDVILTDCPLPMNLIYAKGPENKLLRDLAMERYHRMNNLDIFLVRKKAFNPAGRLQTEKQARALDMKLRGVLTDQKVDFKIVEATPTMTATIPKIVLDKIGYWN